MPLVLEIVTPEAKVYTETVDEVGLPTSEGRMHVLPHHVPVIAKLNAGEIKVVRRDKHDEMLAVGSGFVEIFGDKDHAGFGGLRNPAFSAICLFALRRYLSGILCLPLIQ